MKQVMTLAAQGDLLVVRVDALPDGLTEEKHNGRIVAAHSETGHDHVVEGMAAHEARLFRGADPLTCYLQLQGSGAEVVHHRPFDTHETLGLGPGLWMLRNQREYSPEYWRRVCD